jgi:phosphotransferase system IIB component
MATGFLSPTNVKHWKGYVDMLADEEGVPPWAVVTEITTFDDQDTQIRVEFNLVEKIEDDDLLTALEQRADVEKVQNALQVPYGPKTERTAPVKKGSVGKSKKFVNASGRR